MKKKVAIILCIALVLSQSVYIFSGSNKEVVLGLDKDTINLVTLGSSQSIGWGLSSFFAEQFKNWRGSQDDYASWDLYRWNSNVWNPIFMYEADTSNCGYITDGLGVVAEGAFPDLMRDYFEEKGYSVDLKQLGCAGFRSNEIVYLLYDDYSLDEYGISMFYDWTNFKKFGETEDEGREYLKNLYRTALKEADVITYDLGAGNMCDTIVNDYGDDLDIAYENILPAEDYAKFISFREIIRDRVESLLLERGIDKEDIQGLSGLIDRTTYSFLGYCISLDKTMEWIYENNEDAIVIVMQIQNLTKDFFIDIDGVEIPGGDIINVLISLANNYAASKSEYANRYYYSRITDDERVRFIYDDVVEYEGLDDLTDTLKVAFDLGPGGETNLVRPKDVFTGIYEDLGKDVNNEEYIDALDNAYDVFIKFAKYILNSDAINNTDGDTYNIDSLYSSLMYSIIKDATNNYFDGKDNSIALETAIEKFNALSKDDQGKIKLNIGVGIFSLPHPDEIGCKEMADAVIYTIENEQKGISSMISGIKNCVLDLRYTMNKLASNAVKNIKNNFEENFILRTNKPTSNPFNNVIKKAR